MPLIETGTWDRKRRASRDVAIGAVERKRGGIGGALLTLGALFIGAAVFTRRQRAKDWPHAPHNPPRRTPAPRAWYTKPIPKKRQLSYRRKTDALNVFRSENQQIIDHWGGETIGAAPSEFDAINQRYDYHGKNAVTTISDALWASLPASSGPPYQLEDIDVELLNATSPGQYGRGFRLPDYVEDAIAERELTTGQEELFVEQFERADCFTKYRDQAGRFNGRGRRPAGVGRERSCQCRTERGRFVACPVHAAPVIDVEDVPF